MQKLLPRASPAAKIISKCGDLKLQVGEGSPQLGGSPQAGSAHLFFKGNSQKVITSTSGQG